MKRTWMLGLWLALLSSGLVRGQTLPAPVSAQPDSAVVENSLGMKFRKVPGTPVLFAIWETRGQDYGAFLKSTGREWSKPSFAQTAAEPVVNVTWDDAMAFCNWLTAQERSSGRLTTKQHYRLPKDEEWSTAVGLALEQGRTPEERMKNAIVWPWGCTWPPLPGQGNYAPSLGCDSFENTAPVGRFKPNRFGLYDLGGNVWEWCEDWFNRAAVTRVLRGGSFHDDQPKDLLAANRFSATMHLSNDDIGFRIVLESKD